MTSFFVVQYVEMLATISVNKQGYVNHAAMYTEPVEVVAG